MARIQYGFESIGRQHNLYDCYDVTVGEYSLRLFENRNVGNAELSNLQVPGQTHFEEGSEFVIQRWYARTTVPDSVIANAYFNSAQVTLVIGSRFIWQLSLAELLERRPRYREGVAVQPFDPFPACVPYRQIISVNVDRFGAQQREALASELAQRWNVAAPYRVWVHLEGIIVNDKKIIEALREHEKRARTIEERIKDWILGHAPDDDAGKAQAQAYADAIEEGRHRG